MKFRDMRVVAILNSFLISILVALSINYSKSNLACTLTSQRIHIQNDSSSRGPRELYQTQRSDVRQGNVSACVAEGYSIVVSSYDRSEALAAAISHWLSCKRVREVHVVYHNPSAQFPDIAIAAANSSRGAAFLRVRLYPDNKLTNRFALPDVSNKDTRFGFATRAIFHVDDDEGIDCRLMSAAHDVWCEMQDRHGLQIRKSAPFVGFEPRLFDLVSTNQGPMGYIWNASCSGGCLYNTLWVTKGAFLSTEQMAEFWRPEYASLRAIVDSFITGEDMLMSAILMAAKAQPIAVHAASNTPQHPDAIPDALKHLTPSLGMRSSKHRIDVRNMLQKAFCATDMCSRFWKPSMIWWIVSLNGGSAAKAVESPCRNMQVRCTNA